MYSDKPDSTTGLHPLPEKHENFLLYLLSIDAPFNRFDVYERFRTNATERLLYEEMMVQFHFENWIRVHNLIVLDDSEEYNYILTDEGRKVAQNLGK